jgi:hypothetical protein
MGNLLKRTEKKKTERWGGENYRGRRQEKGEPPLFFLSTTATVAPHSNLSTAPSESHQQLHPQQRPKGEEPNRSRRGRKKTEAGASARGRRRKTASNTARHRHNHREPSSASSPPPPASL